MVQWLGLHAFTAEGQGSIPGWGTRIPQATRRGQKKKNRICPIHSFSKERDALGVLQKVNSVWARAIRGGFMGEVGIDLGHQGWERENLVK